MKLPTFFQKQRLRPRFRVVPPVFVLFVLGLFYGVAFSSCTTDRGCSGEGGTAYDEPFLMSLVDHEGNDLLGLYGIYDYDEVTVTDEEGELVDGFESGLANNLVWAPLGRDTALVANEEKSYRFFLYLDDRDTDTLDMNIETVFDKCDFLQVSFFEIFYNDSLYYSGDRIPQITITKNL